MSPNLKRSTIRGLSGLGLLLLALAAAAFLLPDASQQLALKQRESANAQRALEAQRQALARDQELAGRLKRDQEAMSAMLSSMPTDSAGALQWRLSRVLHELVQKHGLRLVAVKYGQPSREGAKDSGLEVLEVEFTLLGVHSSIKPFMLELEGMSDLPFAVSGVKLDESPEGARLTATLRAFRKAGAAGNGEGSR